MNFSHRPLGREIARYADHIGQYPYRVVRRVVVEKVLAVPDEHIYDQNGFGACVGAALSGVMTYYNGKLYKWEWLWRKAKQWDDFPDTIYSDDNGTSAVGACRVLKKFGHIVQGKRLPSKSEGIKEYRWLSTIDQIRDAISRGYPVAFGCNWYSNFDTPRKYKGESWIGRSKNLGILRGGHETYFVGNSDKRRALLLCNSWGTDYGDKGKVWIGWDVVERLMREMGDLMAVTDRI